MTFLSCFAALDHPHSFSCKLELGSDQEIPNDWYPFVTMECEIVGAVVSQTRVKSLGTVNDIQPQKHVTSWTRYHCQVRCFNGKIKISSSVLNCGSIFFFFNLLELTFFFLSFLRWKWKRNGLKQSHRGSLAV